MDHQVDDEPKEAENTKIKSNEMGKKGQVFWKTGAVIHAPSVSMPMSQRAACPSMQYEYGFGLGTAPMWQASNREWPAALKVQTVLVLIFFTFFNYSFKLLIS